MDLNERIKNIGGYFKFMNITPEVYYILASFPEKWVVPTNANENVKIMKHDGEGFYFYTEVVNGYEVLFDVIDEIIRQNREIEEKFKLFNSKLGELKKLFENEDLITLENMKFTIDGMEPPALTTEETPVSETGVSNPSEIVEETQSENNEKDAVEQTEEKTYGKKKKKNVGLSIMDTAKKLVES